MANSSLPIETFGNVGVLMFKAASHTSETMRKISDKYGISITFKHGMDKVQDGTAIVGGSLLSLDYKIKLWFINEYELSFLNIYKF